ncbi:hypothetical protein KP79_PYT02214 [Mizuhopecten yessoensis]|uniref:Uncharacterized protein n=1 Tax=Mizuhopecten yessoensis TaxID=6573 RepID=A0A210PXF6_MIZYE|nr:hypothetical protein KP79_PYT02214 [Mizuhopecten yessoensis]
MACQPPEEEQAQAQRSTPSSRSLSICPRSIEGHGGRAWRWHRDTAMFRVGLTFFTLSHSVEAVKRAVLRAQGCDIVAGLCRRRAGKFR